MICDKCVKKTVCKLCDGSEIKGCIEFYRPHKEVLQEIRQQLDDEIATWKKYETDITVTIRDTPSRLTGLVRATEIIDKQIKEYTE